MPQMLQWATLGLGVYQTIAGQQAQREALDWAKRPRLTPEQQATIRREGTSNLQANLASRNLLDSSLLPGGLTDLEKKIAEATAAAGTQGDVSGMLAQWAREMGAGGAQTLGSLAEWYMLNRLMGGKGGWNPFGATPTGFLTPVEQAPQTPWYKTWEPGMPLPYWAQEWQP